MRGVGYISVSGHDDVWFLAQAFERTGLSSIAPGTEVWFTLRTLPDGRPSARDIEPIETPAVLSNPVVTKQQASTEPTAGTLPPGSKASAALSRGVLDWVHPTGAYGFIECDDKRRIFISGKVLGASGQDIQVGSRVEFRTFKEAGGKVRAQDVTVFGASPVPASVRRRGVVVGLNDRCGFIASEASAAGAMFGRSRPAGSDSDIFFNRDALTWNGLDDIVQVGSTVEYDLHIHHASGRVTARNIQPVGAAARAETDQYRSARVSDQPRRFG